MDVAVGVAHEAIAATRPDQEALVFRDRRLTWAELTARTRRLANALHDRGLGCHKERAALAGWESGQDHLAIYATNGNEYLEAMLGAFKARVAPLNVNYRYTAGELLHVLDDSAARAVVVHSRFTPTLAEVLPALPHVQTVLQIPDESGLGLLPGAVWYEDALAAAPATPPLVAPSPDDLYILYTGGTTGAPKGVLWRQGDAWTECFGGSRSATTLDDVVAGTSVGLKALLAPPFMHGAGHWMSLRTWNLGGTVVIQDEPRHLDPADIWRTVERERVNFLLIVGDAFARPLVDELAAREYDLSSLTVLLSGGAPLSARLKDALLARLPALMIVDGLGSSEAGGQVSHVSTGGGATTGIFAMEPGNHVLSADLSRPLAPGEGELGWLAKSGRLALGYLGDPEKTARTYPVIGGVRYVVPGDRARLRADGTMELHGRDSVTINSGGEKIFAEEVEAAVTAHDAVYDCVVAARPSERWGQEVVAIVHLRPGCDVDEAALLAEAERHVARYKLPKAFVFVDRVARSPAGKADYRWAAAVAAGGGREAAPTTADAPHPAP
ncbi:MAG TPA: acyl-CoA synthetase [Acidimicrobiales bacterium]|nr:acyl-CoA synthetase [Acidimicrobiales bacterium]